MDTTNYKPGKTSTSVKYKTLSVGALNIAYREAGDPANPKLVLLHGFPSSSHQYRNLVSSLADRFHVIAPDYPGFGNSDLPDPKEFAYTFDNLADVIGHFLEQKGFTRFGMYVQDLGGQSVSGSSRRSRRYWNGSSSRTQTRMRWDLRMLGKGYVGLCGKTARRRPQRALQGYSNLKRGRPSIFTALSCRS